METVETRNGHNDIINLDAPGSHMGNFVDSDKRLE